MSVTISCENLIKKYGDKVIIPELSLKINQGEFFTLLGPSGCGKTTLLRMIAGFNSIEGGKILFDDKVINKVAPKDRNIGMVFQNYAIFPNLTVAKNVSFGLENRKVDKVTINEKVQKILDIVKISHLSNILPKNMSGGQQQRIALARAIVIQPNVLLMDEPLSNLDAKLRVEMRDAIKKIQRDVNITTVYVTHDQEEAMAVSDRIAVMNLGQIQQIGSPQNIYHRPANIFVASFIGRTNVLEADLIQENNKTYIKLTDDYKFEINSVDFDTHKKVKVSIRPEDFRITNEDTNFKGVITNSTFLGINTHYEIELENKNNIEVIQESSLDNIIPDGTTVNISINNDKVNVFDFDTEQSITKGVVNHV